MMYVVQCINVLMYEWKVTSYEYKVIIEIRDVELVETSRCGFGRLSHQFRQKIRKDLNNSIF